MGVKLIRVKKVLQLNSYKELKLNNVVALKYVERYFYLWRQLAACQVMGPVVVIVVLPLLVFKTFTHISNSQGN